MSIPKYDDMYCEFLEALSDKHSHLMREVTEILASRFHVTEQERQLLLPSGRQAIFDNRVGWTRTYLKKAGLVGSPARGSVILTETGQQVLADKPSRIDNDYLSQFESFRQFQSASDTTQKEQVSNDSPVTGKGLSPQDVLDSAYQQIHQALADELLAEIMRQSPAFFERLVVELLESMGYGGSLEKAGAVLGKSGDEGIDGVIREDKLGFSMIYIQAKRWDLDATVSRPEIQKFVGALAGQGASKGLFITTGHFSAEAKAYAEKQHTTKVVLVDGEALARLMIEYNVGVSTESTYQIKRIDSDFFTSTGE